MTESNLFDKVTSHEYIIGNYVLNWGCTGFDECVSAFTACRCEGALS